MKKNNAFRYIFSLFSILVLWHLSSKALNTPALPLPHTAIKEFIIVFNKLYIHIIYSFSRILVASAISMILAVPIGLIIGRYKFLDYLFSPIIYMLYPIPKIALLPVIMLLLGIGNISKVVMIFIIVFFQIIVTCRDEAARIRREQYYFMESIGSTELQMFKHIVFPHSLPAIFTSVRLSLGTSISVLFFSESFGTDWGIGYYIIDSWMRINYPEMFAGIIGLSLMGIILFISVDVFEKMICPWK